MAFRRPLKTVNGNLYEMQDWEISEIAQRARWLYVQSPSVTLSVVGAWGNLGTLYDTRLQAGAAATSISAFPTEATTDEPSVVSVGYDRLMQGVDAVDLGVYADDGRKYPVYYDGSNIRSMTLQDMYDTFIFSAINMCYKDVYYVHYDYTLNTDWALQSWTPVFSDTGADTSQYTAAGISETLDQPYTRANFYLFKRNATIPGMSSMPLYTNWQGEHIQQYPQSTFDDILLRLTRYVAANVPGYRIRYSWNGNGTDQGAVWDDRLNGSGNYQQSTVYNSGDDYRSQEFPDGSFYRVSTYYLRARTE